MFNFIKAVLIQAVLSLKFLTCGIIGIFEALEAVLTGKPHLHGVFSVGLLHLRCPYILDWTQE